MFFFETDESALIARMQRRSGASEHRLATFSLVFASNQSQEKAGGARVRCACRTKRLKTVVLPLPISSRPAETVGASHV